MSPSNPAILVLCSAVHSASNDSRQNTARRRKSMKPGRNMWCRRWSEWSTKSLTLTSRVTSLKNVHNTYFIKQERSLSIQPQQQAYNSLKRQNKTRTTSKPRGKQKSNLSETSRGPKLGPTSKRNDRGHDDCAHAKATKWPTRSRNRSIFSSLWRPSS
jgi:hypothetical protein